METYVCPRCGNQDQKYFGQKKDGSFYCRRCISFQGKEAKETSPPYPAKLHLDYPLSPFQEKLSSKLVENFENKKDSLIHAVCGAGKTELILKTIETALLMGKRPGFAVPRRDVAIELYGRLKNSFPSAKCVLVYGGETENLEGDIIVLTTHQLYRYPHYFDLLIVDEIDAFPYKGDFVLNAFVKKAVRGNLILMSATPPKDILEEFAKEKKSILHLDARFHLKAMPVPSFKECLHALQVFYAAYRLKEYQKERKPCFVFAPTIYECELAGKILKYFFKEGEIVHSQKENRSFLIEQFREGKIPFLVTTSVLERGVTLKNLQVIVLHADEENIYDAATLIQIAGRVGRKKGFEKGDVLFLGEKKTESIKSAIGEIEKSNGNLQSLLS